MKTTILTVTFDRDLPMLKHSMRSIENHGHEFSGHHIVIDDHKQDCIHTEAWLKSTNKTYFKNYEAKNIGYGYVRQQYMKFYSDQYVDDDTDWICHVDSDTIFCDDVAASDFFTDHRNRQTGGRPILWYAPYVQLGGSIEEWKHYHKAEPGLDAWRYNTSHFLNETVDHEFMRRMPLLYPRWLFPEIRKFIEDTHGMSVLDYLISRPIFTEYNAFGAYCWKYHKDIYAWTHVPQQYHSTLPIIQAWSQYQETIDEQMRVLSTDKEVFRKTKKIAEAIFVGYWNGNYAKLDEMWNTVSDLGITYDQFREMWDIYASDKNPNWDCFSLQDTGCVQLYNKVYEGLRGKPLKGLNHGFKNVDIIK